MTGLSEILKSAAPEQLEKALNCKTAEELIDFLKAEKIKITDEQAQAIRKMSAPKEELTEEVLDNVTGGWQMGPPVIPTYAYPPGYFRDYACPSCQSKNVRFSRFYDLYQVTCNDCGYSGLA